MKNFAKLTLLFSLSFSILFSAALLLRFLSTWIDIARAIPVVVLPGQDAADLAWRALPAALYLTILLILSYSARRKISFPLTLFCTLAMASIFTIGVAAGLDRAENLRPVLRPASPIQAGPGLILSRLNNYIILLRDTSDIQGPRLVSIPDQPFIYQEIPRGPNNTILGLPAISFGNEPPWFIRSLNMDFSLNAEEMRSRFEYNFNYFAVYIFSLILLLGSLRFLLELSNWPLANIFLGALVFRGILALEIFLNSREINALIGSFLGGILPSMLITPLVFSGLSALLIIYTMLSRLARKTVSKRRRRSRND